MRTANITYQRVRVPRTMQQFSRIDILSTIAFQGTLAGWRKQRVKKNKERKSTDADIHKENSRLKKEIAELKNANEILKDALTFFVQDRKK